MDKETLMQILDKKNIFSKNPLTIKVLENIEQSIAKLEENQDCKIESVFFNRNKLVFEVELWDCDYNNQLEDKIYSIDFIANLLNKNLNYNIDIKQQMV